MFRLCFDILLTCSKHNETSMASVNFNLLRPYKKSSSKDPLIAKKENLAIREEIKRRRKQGKSIDSLLNPKETRIYIHFILDRNNILRFKTDEKVIPKKWDFKKGCAKSFPGSIDLNLKLDKLKNNIITTYRNTTARKEAVTIEEVEEALKAVVIGHQPIIRKKNFFDYYEEFIAYKATINEKGTLKEYRNVFHALKEFNEMHHYGLTFEKLDMKFYDKFLHYLTDEKQNVQSGGIGLRNDTIGKYIATLKLFMQWALERGYHTNIIYQNKSFNPYPFKRDRNQRQQNNKKEIVTITKEELEYLFSLDLSNNKRLEKVKDLFVFGCYTGQRWSDIENFKKEDIKNNAWEFEAHKTKKFTRVPFVGFCAPALTILKKYDYDLPKITNQKFNLYIKEVFRVVGFNRNVLIKRYSGKKLLKIDQPLHEYASAHMARRTAVTLLLESGMSMLMVMKLTNHTDTRTLLKYENAGQDALEQALIKGNLDTDNLRAIASEF